MHPPVQPTAPIQPHPDDGLHADLTKLADEAPTEIPPGLDEWERGRWTAQRDLGLALRALLAAHPAPAPVSDPTGHEFIGVAGHPDDDECTYRADGTDATYCGARKESHAPAPVSDTGREDAGVAGPDSASGRGVQVPDYYGDGHLEITARPDREYADITLNTYGHWSIDTTVTNLVAAIEEAGGPRLAVIPAPVSDTRRVADLAATICDGNTEHLRAWPLVAESAYCGQCHSAAERALTVLAAPPVVDEEELRERIAQVLWPYPNAFESAPPSYRDYYLEKADAVRAALPAPPVVDEAEIAAVLNRADAEYSAREFLTDAGAHRHEPGDWWAFMAAAVAAHLRGATRG